MRLFVTPIHGTNSLMIHGVSGLTEDAMDTKTRKSFVQVRPKPGYLYRAGKAKADEVMPNGKPSWIIRARNPDHAADVVLERLGIRIERIVSR